MIERKDPEGILGPPKTGLIARQEFKRRMERDADAREEFEKHMIQEKARRQSLREVRILFEFRILCFNWSFVCCELLDLIKRCVCVFLASVSSRSCVSNGARGVLS